MSFFPRSFVSQEANPSSFHPLFRLLNDFDEYNNNTNSGNNSGSNNKHIHQTRSIMKSFTPKFDVKEVGNVYELHGELPGIDQKDVSIEFTDAETLTIKGRTERSYTAGTPSSNAGSIGGSSTKALGDSSHKDKEHQPSVEDEDSENNKNTTMATTSNGGNKDVSSRSKEPEAKYWVSERSVGEFSRSFTFPVRVDQEQVKASMKNGVLSVVVPKAKKSEARKIAIE